MLAADIRQRILDDFGDAAASIEARLDAFASQLRGEQGVEPGDRLLRAIVVLADGDAGSLARTIEVALVDWRDVLVAAEYEDDEERLRDCSQPFQGVAGSEAPDVSATSGPTRPPEQVVTDFIAAMNAWERAAHAAERSVRHSPDPASYWPQVHESLQRVVDEFCTRRPRPQGRAGMYQRPPEYDPSAECVVHVELRDRRAWVETDRTAVLGGGRRRYVLHRQGAQWLIDNVKRADDDGVWQRETL